MQCGYPQGTRLYASPECVSFHMSVPQSGWPAAVQSFASRCSSHIMSPLKMAQLSIHRTIGSAYRGGPSRPLPTQPIGYYVFYLYQVRSYQWTGRWPWLSKSRDCFMMSHLHTRPGQELGPVYPHPTYRTKEEICRCSVVLIKDCPSVSCHTGDRTKHQKELCAQEALS